MTLLSSQELSVLGFRDPTAAQAYTWPYVSSGQDVVFVSPPLSGKTLTYLLPLLTTISAPTPRDSSEKYSGVCLLRCSTYHCKIIILWAITLSRNVHCSCWLLTGHIFAALYWLPRAFITFLLPSTFSYIPFSPLPIFPFLDYPLSLLPPLQFSLSLSLSLSPSPLTHCPHTFTSAAHPDHPCVHKLAG